MSCRISWNMCRGDGDLGHLKGDVSTVADCTFALILICFSFKLVSDQLF